MKKIKKPILILSGAIFGSLLLTDANAYMNVAICVSNNTTVPIAVKNISSSTSNPSIISDKLSNSVLNPKPSSDFDLTRCYYATSALGVKIRFSLHYQSALGVERALDYKFDSPFVGSTGCSVSNLAPGINVQQQCTYQMNDNGTSIYVLQISGTPTTSASSPSSVCSDPNLPGYERRLMCRP